MEIELKKSDGDRNEDQKSPLITVGVSTFNRKTYLRESLKSLENQTFRDFEIIVADDGSTDGTQEMMIMGRRREREMRMHVRNATKLVVEGRTSCYNDFSTLGLCKPLFSPFPCFFRSLYPSSSF